MSKSQNRFWKRTAKLEDSHFPISKLTTKQYVTGIRTDRLTKGTELRPRSKRIHWRPTDFLQVGQDHSIGRNLSLQQWCRDNWTSTCGRMKLDPTSLFHPTSKMRPELGKPFFRNLKSLIQGPEDNGLEGSSGKPNPSYQPTVTRTMRRVHGTSKGLCRVPLSNVPVQPRSRDSPGNTDQSKKEKKAAA